MARRDPDLQVVGTLSRKQPEERTGYRRRIDTSMLAEACFPPESLCLWPHGFCGGRLELQG